MKNFSITAIAAMTTLGLSSTAQAESIFDILQRKAEASDDAAKTLPPYSYVVHVETRESSSDNDEDTEQFSGKVKVDLSKPAGQRTEILSVSSEDGNAEFDRFIEKLNDPKTTTADLADDFWCDGQSDFMSKDGAVNRENFSVISENDSQAVLRATSGDIIAKMMEEDDEESSMDDRKMMDKMVKKMASEIELSKPSGDVKAFKVWLTEPVSLKVIAKITKLEYSQGCDMAPNGRPYVSDMNMTISGSALTMNFTEDVKIKISDLQPN